MAIKLNVRPFEQRNEPYLFVFDYKKTRIGNSFADFPHRVFNNLILTIKY